MAIPDNLFRVWIEVKRQNPSQTVTYWESVSVWYVLASDAGADPLDVAAPFATHYNQGIVNNWVVDRTAVTRYGGRNVAAGGVDTVQNTGNLPGAGIPLAMPPQCAVLVLGRSFAVRRQTRKWIPAAPYNWVDNETGFVLDTNAPLVGWWKGFLTQKVNGGLTIEPVVWDAENEILHDINSIAVMRGWRTIRRRSLAETGEF